jgi:pimeloyl-ACP methyl ester carboxylesterase
MKKLIGKLLGWYLDTLVKIAPRFAGRQGFYLFCYPFRTPLTDKQKQFFNSAEKFTVRYEKHVVQAYRWGNGSKKIVFLHGWQSHSYRWKAYIDSLSKEEFSIYALDAPGHGMSKGNFLSVPLYSSVIHQFITDLGSVHAVVGHSLGGFTLLYTFYQYPLLPVKKIVLMASPGEASDFINLFKKTLNISEVALARIIDKFERKYKVKPDYFSAQKFAAAVTVPGLIIHDENDPEAPHKYAAQIRKAWSRSRLITTQGLGHNLKSPAMIKEVIDFVSEPSSEIFPAPSEKMHQKTIL